MAKEKINEKHRPTGVDNGGKRIFRKEVDPTTGKMKKQTYYPANNLKGYADANNLGSDTMYKVGKVQARPSVAGRQNQGTVLNGFKEREGYTEKGNGAMIVRNPKGEEYEVPGEEFAKKYTHAGGEPDENGYSTYNVFNQRQVSAPVKNNLYKNMPNWGKGQKQFARKGDAHIVNPSSNDSYFIGNNELKSTHVSKMEESKKVKMNESQLREMIQKIISESLDELSPDYYSANAQKAQNALNGFGGKMMKMFNPNKYNKIQNQAQKFQSYSNDHPDDTYDITSYDWADPTHINNGYQIRNNRTGNVKGFNDANNTIPIRGSVTSNGKYGGEASYLNGMKKMNESQLREFVSKVIKESLNEVRKEINPGEIYRTLLGISDSMRDYAWVATNDMSITTAVSYLNKAIDAWKQVMRDNGAQ